MVRQLQQDETRRRHEQRQPDDVEVEHLRLESAPIDNRRQKRQHDDGGEGGSARLSEPQPRGPAEAPVEIVRGVLVHERFADHGERFEEEDEVAKRQARHLDQDDDVPPPLLLLVVRLRHAVVDPAGQLLGRRDGPVAAGIGPGDGVGGTEERGLGGRGMMLEGLGHGDDEEQT